MPLRLETLLTGIAIGIVSLGTCIFAIVVVFVLLKGGFVRRQQGSFYVLVFANILVDVVITAIFAFYLTPSIFMQVSSSAFHSYGKFRLPI